MAMEVQFSGLVPATRTINLTSEDLVTLHKILVDYFLSMLPHIELTERAGLYDPNKKAIREFTLKYGVDPTHVETLVNFYSAILLQSKGNG